MSITEDFGCAGEVTKSGFYEGIARSLLSLVNT